MTPPALYAPAASVPSQFRRWWVRALWMALLWLGLNGTDPASWVVGGPAVLAAAWISLKLLPDVSWRWSARGALFFAAYFLRESFRGGWDVARRAISPGLALSPAIVCHPLHLPSGPSRLFFCSTISLLPGTAVVAIAESNILVHVLDSSNSVEEGLNELERRVGALFGVELTKTKEPAA